MRQVLLQYINTVLLIQSIKLDGGQVRLQMATDLNGHGLLDIELTHKIRPSYVLKLSQNLF